MIQSLTVRNFRSIRETSLPVTFAEGKAPNGYKESPILSFIQVGEARKARVCPTLALYGANASGKTTLILALQTIVHIVRNGWSDRMYQPNLLCSKTGRQKASDFDIEFWVNGDLYRYLLSINNNGITQEQLQINETVLFSIEKGKVTFFEVESSDIYQDAIQNFKLRCVNAKTQYQVKTFLMEITRALPGVSKELIEARDFLSLSILFVKGEVPFAVGIKALASTFEGSEEEKEQQAIGMMLNYLHKLDIQIVGMRLQERKVSELFKNVPLDHPLRQMQPSDEEGLFYGLSTAHKNDEGKEVWFDFTSESEGTQRLIGLLGYLLASIRVRKVVCIDEIDDSLHSLLVIQLIRLFKEKRINEKGAQLIFTIHNTDLLATDLLGLSEVGIVSQRGFDGSTVIRLVDIPELRNSDEFRRRYLRGEFGGIPFPYV